MDKTRDEKIKADFEKRKKYYQETFSGEGGQYVLEDLKKSCYVDYSTFSKDSLEMAYREGIRSVYLHILRYLRDESSGG